MRRVAVGLWTRDTHDYSIPTDHTLRDLDKAVTQTREWAKQKGITAEAGKLRSIFVAPEFLFTRQRKQGDHSGTTAITRYERDLVLSKILGIAGASPSMLLVPGTIVFGETYTAAWLSWEETRTNDPMKKNPLERAIGNLKQAAEPKFLNDDGKNAGRPPTAKPLTKKAYPTKEAPEDEQNNEGYKKFYNTQISELTAAEKLMVGKISKTLENQFLIKNRTYIFFDKNRIFSYGKKSNMGDYMEDESKGIFVPGKKEGIKEIDGLKVGFEVCFDHNFGILFDHMGASGRNLDLHVICSAEVPNELSKSMAKPGGYLIHASTGTGGQEHTAVYKQGKGPRGDRINPAITYPMGTTGKLHLYVIELDK